MVAFASAFARFAFVAWIIVAVCVTIAGDIFALVGVGVASFMVATVVVNSALLFDTFVVQA